MIEILENVTVVYTDNVTEQFDLLQVTDRGVITGRILDGEFFACGFISKKNIKSIRKGRTLQKK